MKIAAYEVRPDEKPVIENLCKQYGIELISTPANLDNTTARMSASFDGVTTLGQSDYCNEVLDELKGHGVQVLASRCVGYNHMNCDYARSLGFRLCNGLGGKTSHDRVISFSFRMLAMRIGCSPLGVMLSAGFPAENTPLFTLVMLYHLRRKKSKCYGIISKKFHLLI